MKVRSYLIDRARLRDEMARHRVSTEELAAIMGITRQGLYNKLKGSQFNESEVFALRKVFGAGILVRMNGRKLLKDDGMRS